MISSMNDTEEDEIIIVEDFDATQPMLLGSSTPIWRVSSTSNINLSPVNGNLNLTNDSDISPQQKISPPNKRLCDQSSFERRRCESVPSNRERQRDFDVSDPNEMMNSFENSSDKEPGNNIAESRQISDDSYEDGATPTYFLGAREDQFVKSWISDSENALINGFQRCSLFDPSKSVHLFCETRLNVTNYESLGQSIFASNTETKWYCDHGGVPYCNCTEGWTGEHCETPIDYCTHPAKILSNDHMIDVPLCVHGICKYNITLGSWCECESGWFGKYCQNANITKYVANRCIAYGTNFTRDNQSDSIVHHLCDLSKERCIADNIDCVFNVPVKYVDNKPFCDAPKDQKCKCTYPIGWCIPLEPANNIISKMALRLKAYVDPFFYHPRISS